LGVYRYCNNFDASPVFRQEIYNSVKRKAIEDISEKPSKLIHKEIPARDPDVETLNVK
jgi:hypothetical protein